MDAVQTTGGGKVSNWVRASVDFVREAYAEMHKITWPTVPELKRATISIVILSVALGMAIGLLDVVLKWTLVDGVARLTR